MTATTKLFNDYGHFLGTIPAECVADCSHSGRCDDDVARWVNTLDFEVPRNLAIDYLASTGGWDREELASEFDARLAERVLWLACREIKEQGEWMGVCQ